MEYAKISREQVRLIQKAIGSNYSEGFLFSKLQEAGLLMSAYDEAELAYESYLKQTIQEDDVIFKLWEAVQELHAKEK